MNKKLTSKSTVEVAVEHVEKLNRIKEATHIGIKFHVENALNAYFETESIKPLLIEVKK